MAGLCPTLSCLQLLCVLFMVLLFPFPFPDKFRCFLFSLLMVSDHHYKSIWVHFFFVFTETKTITKKNRPRSPEKVFSFIYLCFSSLNIRTEKFSFTFRFRSAISGEFQCTICISCVFYFNGFCIIYSWFSSIYFSECNYLFRIFIRERWKKNIWHCRRGRKSAG